MLCGLCAVGGALLFCACAGAGFMLCGLCAVGGALLFCACAGAGPEISFLS